MDLEALANQKRCEETITDLQPNLNPLPNTTDGNTDRERPGQPI